MRVCKKILLGLILALVAGNSIADTYVLGELSNSAPAGYSHNTFSDATTLVLRKELGEKPVIENRGNKLFTYSNAIEVGRYDYADVHFLIVNAYTSGNNYGHLEVVSDSGDKWALGDSLRSGVSSSKQLAIGVSQQGGFLRVTETEIFYIDLATKQVKKISKLPTKFVAAHIGTDNDKRWAIIGADASKKVWMGDGEHWSSSEPDIINEHADLNGALSIFPKDKDEWVGAIYVKFNIFNKGVILLHGRADTPSKHAWAINSDEKNYGLFPAVQWKNGMVTVAGENRSDNKLFSVSIPENIVRSIDYQVPPHAINYQTEKDIQTDGGMSFMVGASLAKLNWNAYSTASTLSDVKYEIASTLFKGVSIEGRYQSRNLALSYVKNEVEDMAFKSGGTIGKEASSMLFGYVDFDSLFDSSHSMRLTFERADLKGVATYTDINNISQYTAFNNQYSSIAYLDIDKMGDYSKSEYRESKLPVAVGFRKGSSGNASASFFEPEAQFQEILFGLGHDEIAYAYRNESNYMNWYWNGELSIGIGRLKVSDSTSQKATAAGVDGCSSSTLIWGVHGNIEAGYLIQQRSSSLRGFGNSFSAGIRFKGDYLNRVSGDWNWSYIDFERYDILYGPFVRYNLIF